MTDEQIRVNGVFSPKIAQELNELLRKNLCEISYFSKDYFPKRYDKSASKQYMFWCAVMNFNAFMSDCSPIIYRKDFKNIRKVLIGNSQAERELEEIANNVKYMRQIFAHNRPDNIREAFFRLKSFFRDIYMRNIDEKEPDINDMGLSDDDWEKALEKICSDMNYVVKVYSEALSSDKTQLDEEYKTAMAKFYATVRTNAVFYKYIENSLRDSHYVRITANWAPKERADKKYEMYKEFSSYCTKKAVEERILSYDTVVDEDTVLGGMLLDFLENKLAQIKEEFSW